MKLTVTTTFENVNQDWLNWYMKNVSTTTKEALEILDRELKGKGTYQFISSEVVGQTEITATTTYKLQVRE